MECWRHPKAYLAILPHLLLGFADAALLLQKFADDLAFIVSEQAVCYRFSRLDVFGHFPVYFLGYFVHKIGRGLFVHAHLVVITGHLALRVRWVTSACRQRDERGGRRQPGRLIALKKKWNAPGSCQASKNVPLIPSLD